MDKVETRRSESAAELAGAADLGVAPLDIRDLTKVFPENRLARLTRRGRAGRKPRAAVDGVSFQVSEGEIYGVLGANGSGKSTLIRILSTLLLPDRGTVRVFGHDAVKAARRRSGLCSTGSPPTRRSSARCRRMENLLFFGRAYGIDRPGGAPAQHRDPGAASGSGTTTPASPCCTYPGVSSRRWRWRGRS